MCIRDSYLSEIELQRLNLLVSGFLDFAEFQALEMNPMTMKDWIEAVSYTHLMLADILLGRTIYLCQLTLCKPQILIFKAHRHTSYFVIVLIEYYVAVSYTHLDVYKRQSASRGCDDFAT